MISHNGMLPLEKLKQLALENREQYASNQPFPHIVLDDVFPPEILDVVLKEFETGELKWKEYSSKYEKKFQMNEDASMPEVSRQFLHNLNSQPFLEFLSVLTGIEGLIPDPYLKGGGYHQIPRGGKLGIHIDFNRHNVMSVYRRLNVIIYLNKDWDESYGGHFELWNELDGECKKKVLPIFNRMAIFTTTQKSFHGHPNPLTCPEDRCRRSLALYYYTSEDSGEQKKGRHSTVFLNEKGERDDLGFKRGLFTRLRDALKK